MFGFQRRRKEVGLRRVMEEYIEVQYISILSEPLRGKKHALLHSLRFFRLPLRLRRIDGPFFRHLCAI
jgi:hypothetical protein